MEITQTDIQRIIDSIRENSDYDFQNYSIRSFTRRIDKSLFDFKLDVNGLINKIKNEEGFVTKLVNNITVNTTEMFRDIEMWHSLKYNILRTFSDNISIKIWHAGCSTGQEVYSMLILLNELGLMEKAKVYASDLNNSVLKTAALGEYSYKYNSVYFDNFEKIVRKNPSNPKYYNDVPYSRYFEINKIKQTIKINESLRKKPVWVHHDLVKEGELFNTQFDIILCRNVLIYFDIILQFDVVERFYNSLYDGGTIILGNHESIMGPLANNFKKEGFSYKKLRIST